MNETGVIAGAIIVLWLGSVEWRLRNSISKDRFSDLIARIDRIEEKIDILLTKGELDRLENDAP